MNDTTWNAPHLADMDLIDADGNPALAYNPADAVLVAYLQKEAGWGSWIKVTVADTPEADAAAAAFFRRATAYPRQDGEKYHAACVDEAASTALGQAMAEFFFPTCEHGMSAHLCMGPDHYPSREQEMQNGW